MSDANRCRFRAWDIETRTMHRPDVIDHRLDIWSGTRWTYENDCGELTTQDFGILMQSTGLLDSEDAEMFDGDIIDAGTGRMVLTWGSGAYVLIDAKGTRHALGGWYCHKNCTVIGNIHQNPELLTD